ILILARRITKHTIRNQTLSTKEKILHASLHLFNENGTDAVTVRHIAAKIGISHGNLCYHFKRKEDIIYALFQKLVEEMTTHIQVITPQEFSFAFLYNEVIRS